MALLDFVKDAGEKLFDLFSGASEEKNKEAANKLTQVISGLGLRADNLMIRFKDGIASISGTAPSQEEKEKILLAVGNTQGVAKVDDQLKVAKHEPEANFYTVKSGDTLSRISKSVYGDPNKYMLIFEANKPLLKDPNKIYPGQMLRIPPLH
ncbi:peptidoglycan-binding protein LysM [Desulfuromonas versatilis]|uniref:Peptidoglycan-binding protein LysM n=1 Tax=Desulfuromonas versatilis TaxID=2802975 RepID=A0ABM8HVG7_9BACT|nr:peptidoglycan-binding protein LysM [Desulfuromonas versatilis]BCR04715.1 peptidoglycan-binding protein LysM [Desulfuromonas versatilis]